MFFDDINWCSGLLLKPQHMQSLKKLNYYKLWDILRKNIPNSWGVVDFEYDLSMIQDEKIYIIKLFMINKDGSLIDYCVEDNFKIVVDLKGMKVDGDNEYFLYCATINYNEKDNLNYERYYKHSYGPVSDPENPDDSEYLEFLKIKPFFFLKDNLLAKHTYIPILKITKKKNIWNILSYIPPKIYFKKDNLLIKNIKLIIDTLIVKLNKCLTNININLNKQNIEYKTIINIRQHDLLYDSVYRIRDLYNLENIYPHTLFNELCILINKLYVLHKTNNVLSIYYDHERIDFIFNKLYLQLETLVNSILNESMEYHHFVVDKEFIKLSINEEYIVNNKIYIQINVLFSLESKNIISELNNILCCSKNFYHEVASLRISGVKRKIVQDVQLLSGIKGIENLNNTYYMEIDIKDEYFNMNDELIISIKNKILEKYSFNIIYTKK